MGPQKIHRKRTTILSTDVQGYSRLLADDESATLHTLKNYREIIWSHIERHDGRVIDSPGDNVLAEFGNPVRAVTCAAEIQSELGEQNEALPERRRMRFRIGIHLGDVMVDGDRLCGEGVSIADRLEGLAEGGGIWISGEARREVEGRVPFGFADEGAHSVLNLPQPVRAHRVLTEAAGAEALAIPGMTRGWRWTGRVALAVAIAAAAWYFFSPG